jgi:hypothetical protein
MVTKYVSEVMKFQWPKNPGEVRDIIKRQLEWLLDGLQTDPKKAHPNSIETDGMIF